MFKRAINNVIVFGECMVELVNRENDQLSKSFAGDTYNTAVYLKRCSPTQSVSFLTAIGADFLSNELLLSMGKEQLNTQYVYRSNDRNLGLYMVRTDEHGERTFAYWRANSAATQTINLMNDSPDNANLFYFSGISLAILDVPQREQLFTKINALKGQGCIIAFDPNYRERLWPDKATAQHWINKGYASADIAFPGGDDHLALYGHTDADAIFSHLQTYNINEIVVKNGAIGVHIAIAGQRYIVPVERVQKVIDTTAAGDAFNGGYLAARLQQKSCTDAAGFGAKVAAAVISYPGAIVAKADFFRHISPL